MYRAVVDRDQSYIGVFWLGVRTTMIFCRPGCPARCPRRENIVFFLSTDAARDAGFRPCLRCRPLETDDEPRWLPTVLARINAEPQTPLRDRQLRQLGVEPSTVRRWFKQHYGMTFQSFARRRRLGAALDQLNAGADLTDTAYQSGYQSPSGFREAFAKAFGEPPGRARDRRALSYRRIATPLGEMVAAASEREICLLAFCQPTQRLEHQLQRLAGHARCPAIARSSPLLDRLAEQLAEYFAAQRAAFDLPIAEWGTPFQCRVWRELCAIPIGETISYGTLAHRIDCRGGQRAVGRANGENRLAIIVPCHRVVRSDGALGGYGGEVWRKARLLELEQRWQAERS